MEYSKIPQDNTNLRAHQKEAKKKIFEAWDKYDSVMLQMPTGTGKTYLFTSLINDLLCHYKSVHKEINILVVAHRTELLDQISSTLSRFGIAHGFIQGAREQQLWKRVQVGSIMSLLTEKNYNNVSRQKFDYIIVDASTIPTRAIICSTANPWLTLRRRTAHATVADASASCSRASTSSTNLPLRRMSTCSCAIWA